MHWIKVVADCTNQGKKESEDKEQGRLEYVSRGMRVCIFLKKETLLTNAF